MLHVIGIAIMRTGASVMPNKFNKITSLVFLSLLFASLMLIVARASTTPSSLAYDPATGILYVTNSSGNTVFVVNAPTNTVINSIIVGNGPVSIAINPSNTLAYVANNGDSTISVISLVKNKVINTITGANSPNILAFNPSGTTAYVTEGGNDVVSVIDVSLNAITNSIKLPYSCSGEILNGVAFTPDGTNALAVSGCSGGSGSANAEVINVATNTIIATIGLNSNDNPQGVAISPTSAFAYVSTGYESSFDLLNLRTDAVVGGYISTGPWPSAIAFNQQGTLAYQVVGSGSGTVAVINPAGNTVINTIDIGIQGGGNPVPSAIAFSPTGAVAWVTNFGSSTVSVINVVSNTVINTITMSIPKIPALTLANSLTANSIDVVIGSASDNALITATCPSGDTCQIDNSVDADLVSGTNTINLPYNSLPSGYSTLYANDITSGFKSGNVYVRRITEANALRLTFTNTEPSTEPGNASLIVRFNASKYTELESNTLNNTAMAFNNGTVAYSWLEGNSIGEQNPANELSESDNVVYWFKTPESNTFLGADTGNVVTNSLLFIFAPTSNNLLDGNFVGEAPQLSCPNANAMTCTGTYAQYDNGQSIFTYYTNFAGYNVPVGWNTIETADLVVNNGISFTGAGTGGEEAQMTMNATYARPISIDLLSEVLGANPVYDIGYANKTGAFTGGYQISGQDANEFDVYIATPLVDTHDGTPVAYANVISDVWNPVTLGIGPLSIHDEVGYVPFSTYNDTTYNNYHPFFGSWWTDKSVFAQWFRVRNSYDSNVSLSPPYVTPVNPTAPTLYLSGSASNSITVVEGTSQDNGLITANCYPADACEIYTSAGTVLAYNITFVSIPYNSLALGTTTLYANDISASLISDYSQVDRTSPATSQSPGGAIGSTGGLPPQQQSSVSSTVPLTTTAASTITSTTATTINTTTTVLSTTIIIKTTSTIVQNTTNSTGSAIKGGLSQIGISSKFAWPIIIAIIVVLLLLYWLIVGARRRRKKTT
jgi:YVTN family beta-propeller protein